MGISTGCTPCECGIWGACLNEKFPAFLQNSPISIFVVLFIWLFSPFLIIFPIVIGLRIVLHFILGKFIDPKILNIISVISPLGLLMILSPIIFSLRAQSNPDFRIPIIFAFLLSYLILWFFSFKRSLAQANSLWSGIGVLALEIVAGSIISSFIT